jgi:hypothetical protein
MGAEQVATKRFGVVAGQHVAHGDEVAQRFTRLLAVDVEEAKAAGVLWNEARMRLAGSFPFFLCALLACGGATREFDGAVYRDGPLAFRIGTVPADWHRVEVEKAALAFRDESHEGSVLVNGRCGGKDDDTPLQALTGHLIMGTTERDFVKEDTIPFDGREARHTVMRAKLDGVPMTYDIYVAKKNGCIYDFVYVASPARFEAGAPAFERFVGAFQTLNGGAP